MHIRLWRFEASPGREADFLHVYGPEGDWVQLFRTWPGFLGTDVVHDTERQCWFVVDRWESLAAFQAFRAARRAEHDALDARCRDLVVAEEPLGAGELLSR